MVRYYPQFFSMSSPLPIFFGFLLNLAALQQLRTRPHVYGRAFSPGGQIGIHCALNYGIILRAGPVARKEERT